MSELMNEWMKCLMNGGTDGKINTLRDTVMEGRLNG